MSMVGEQEGNQCGEELKCRQREGSDAVAGSVGLLVVLPDL